MSDFKAMEKIWGAEKLASIGAPRVIAFAEKAVERGFYLEITPLPQFPTGVYHLMGKESTGSLLTLKIREQAGIKRNLRIELEVSGVTDKSSNSLELGPKQAAMRLYNPPLKVEFDASKIRSPRPSQLVIKITEDVKGASKTILDETSKKSDWPSGCGNTVGKLRSPLNSQSGRRFGSGKRESLTWRR